MHAELFEVVAAVGQLLGQRMLVDVGPLLAEQILGGGDQAVEMRASAIARSAARRHAGQHGGGRMHVALAVRIAASARAMSRT